MKTTFLMIVSHRRVVLTGEWEVDNESAENL